MSISTDEAREWFCADACRFVCYTIPKDDYRKCKAEGLLSFISGGHELGLISDTDKPEAKVDKPKIDKVCSTCGTYKVDNDCVDCYHYSRWTYVGQRIAELSAENQKLRDMWEKLKAKYKGCDVNLVIGHRNLEEIMTELESGKE